MSDAVVHETGVVMTVKDAYGFIRCAERDDKVFFHFSSVVNLPPKYEISRGDEVSFITVQDQVTKKVSASDVSLLPPGTVQFEVIASAVSRGIIERPLQYQTAYNSGAQDIPPEPFGGRVRDVDTQTIYEFSGRDLVDQFRPPLVLNDQVEFNVFTEKRSGRQGATHLKFVSSPDPNPPPTSPGTDANIEPREIGTIVSLKDNYGFLKCSFPNNRTPRQMFFHFSEIQPPFDPVTHMQPGTEVEFSMGINKRGQAHAVKLTLAPTPSLVVDETRRLSGTILKGIVSKGPKSRRSSSVDLGAITSESGNELLFAGDDQINPQLDLLPGDIVEFAVATNLHTQANNATRVILKVPYPNGRVRGIVTVIKPATKYGFIKTVDETQNLPDSLFFHFSELIDQERDPIVGDHVEFDITYDRDQTSATRVTTLPQGTIVLNTVQLRGRIITEPGQRAAASSSWGPAGPAIRRNSQDSLASLGTLRLSDESMTTLLTKPPILSVPSPDFQFSLTSLLILNCALRPGDIVDFALAINQVNPDGSFTDNRARVSSLRLAPIEGPVEAVFATGGGVIRLNDEVVGFSPKDVIKGVILKTDDIVRVSNLTYNTRLRQRAARAIERIFESPAVDQLTVSHPPTHRLSLTGSTGQQPVRIRQANRIALGPDGTKGFHAYYAALALAQSTVESNSTPKTDETEPAVQ